MELTFTQFNEIMQYFMKEEAFANKFRDLLYAYNKREFIDPYSFNDSTASELIINLLETIFNDTEHWIRYFVYELDCGLSWEPGMIKVEGKDICLSDSWHLWNFLKENYGGN